MIHKYVNPKSSKYRVGQVLYVTHPPRGSGFARGESVIVDRIDHDAYSWRYYVSTRVQGTTGKFGAPSGFPAPQGTVAYTEGWLDEDDLATETEAKDLGLVYP